MVALSSGCFVNHEERLPSADLELVELASHRPASLARVLSAFAEKGVRVAGVHCPCPNRGSSVDLAATGERSTASAEGLLETMELAASLGAEYVVVHAFYCVDGELPADDIERMAALRRDAAAAAPVSISEYTRSDRYLAAKQRATQTLAGLLPELRRKYPRQRLLLENLNPRIGYGGIWMDDVADMAAELDGDVGVCLDVGHLTLAAAVGGGKAADAVRRAGALVRVTHLHQNFGGRYFADRFWDDSRQRPDLQEVDLHLPFLARYRRAEDSPPLNVTVDNSAFASVMEGGARYAGTAPVSEEIPTAPMLNGAVPVESLLSQLNGDVHHVLEFDSRYAPLEDILAEYGLARRGEHPVPL